MKVYTDLHNLSIGPSVITVGNFDGVHLGHRKIIDRMNVVATENNLESVIFSFWPHPRKVFKPDDSSLKFITAMDERIEVINELEVKHLVLFPFNMDFANYSYTYFVEDILINKLKMEHLLLGYNHRFGKGQAGNYETLKPLAKKNEFALEEIGPVFAKDGAISSSLIRRMIYEGAIEMANQYLGYNYYLKGKVEHGMKIGKSLGYPTANIKLTDDNKLFPGHGVYAVNVFQGNVKYKGMLSIGNRPTIKEATKETAIEVHIFDFDDTIYNECIKVEFIARIRDQEKFNSLDELRKKMDEDKQVALERLGKG